MREECEDRHNTFAVLSCYSCNLVLCTKCAVAGRHIRCAGCGTVAESRRAQWSIWAPRAAGGGASAQHGTAWLVCCCCADKENSDGAGRARFAAHGDLKDLCAWCTECAERGGSADLQHTRVEAAAAAANREDRRAGAARRAARAPRGAVPERPHVPLTREPARTRCTRAGGTRLPPRPRVADGNLPWSPNVTRPRPRPPAGGRSGRVPAPLLHSPTTTSDIHTSDIPSIYSVV